MRIGFWARPSVVKNVISAAIEGALIALVYNYFFPPEGSLLLAPLLGAIACVGVVLAFQWFEDRRRRKDLEL